MMKQKKMISISISKSTLALTALLAVGCGQMNGATIAPGGAESITAVDGVKLISAQIDRADDPRSFGQRTYAVNADNHLLLRYETLASAAAHISSTQPVRLKVIAINETEKTNALTGLRVCPLTRNWMMAATWRSAHPFKGGNWTDGGAIEIDECLSPTIPAALPATIASPGTTTTTAAAPADACLETNAVCFDLSDWFKSYVLERHVNFGFALISQDGHTIQIFGDGAGAKVPRILWNSSN